VETSEEVSTQRKRHTVIPIGMYPWSSTSRSKKEDLRGRSSIIGVRKQYFAIAIASRATLLGTVG